MPCCSSSSSKAAATATCGTHHSDSSLTTANVNKPLPLLPPPPTIDDAPERYEAFKQRASISSFEQLLQPPASPARVISSPSRESHPDHERVRVRESGVGTSS